jgi:plasmid maintenance system antidote protein VapI
MVGMLDVVHDENNLNTILANKLVRVLTATPQPWIRLAALIEINSIDTVAR